jgi:hypothetical protein
MIAYNNANVELMRIWAMMWRIWSALAEASYSPTT